MLTWYEFAKIGFYFDFWTVFENHDDIVDVIKVLVTRKVNLLFKKNVTFLPIIGYINEFTTK